MRVSTDIVDGWTVTATDGPGTGALGGRRLPAAVPGTVHDDLLAAGVIPDPYLGEHERATSWVGRTSWTYTTTLVADAAAPGEHIELVAHGLDTVAEVRLGGVTLGTVRNMHRTHRFDVTQLVDGSALELEIAFRAPLDEAEAASQRIGPRPHVNSHPFNALRKNASSFGWDWGPDLSTTGIWRAVSLERWSTARLGPVRTSVDVRPDGTGVVEVVAEVVRARDVELALDLTVAGVTATAGVGVGGSTAKVRLEVPNVERWWPRGYGDQVLHALGATLRAGGTVLDRHDARVGFRTVRVEQPEDADGTGFLLVVNDEPVLVRGYNWIPDDALLPRVDRAAYERSIGQAVASNANLLRVWGGGIYEGEDFYDVCDEQGVLVWQDFPFACAAYSEEDELASEVELEAREAVARLSGRASLALWCGGNECLWGHEDWDWKAPLAGRTWGEGFYRDLLPSIVAELDPGRPYIPGSPFAPTTDRHPNDPHHGPMHIWDVWNDKDYTSYLEYRPRFVAEFGFQGPPTWTTLTRALDEDSLDPWAPAMLAHQKAEDGNGKLARGMAPHLPAPASFEDWHWATSLNQARALRFGVDHFRSLAPTCSGVVVWQLNDCWPVISWAAVDGDGRRKPLWFALRRAFADRSVALVPREVPAAGLLPSPRDGDGRAPGALLLALVNDTGDEWQAQVRVRRTTWAGAVLADEVVPVQVPARSALRLDLPASAGTPDDASDEVVVADVDGLRALVPFVEDVESHIGGPAYDVEVVPREGGVDVVITAGTVLRDVALLVDKAHPDAEVDDMLVSLLPGESVTFRVSAPAPLDAAVLAGPRVLRSANHLAAAARAAVPAG